MTHLDNRRLEMLEKMGIDVWRLRDKPAQQNAAAVTELTDVADEPGGGRAQILPSPGQSPLTLDEIAAQINQCQKCPLHSTRIKAVPGAGNPDSDWMFVGEAPGQNEDQRGEPFVGRAGQLLDAMIAALQMQRSEVFIANVIKCRPPQNRDPYPREVAECEPYLHRQLELVRPKIIVALGRISAQALLKSSQSLGNLRGKVYRYGPSNTPLVITYHPAYLLRSPQQKAKSWQDLLLAKSVVSGQSLSE